jgi:protein-L-isoaspartate O-methyltransferase
MKKASVLCMAMILGGVLACQAQSPVQWSYKTKVVGTDTYEVRIIATIQDGWHLYAGKQPEDAIAVPTSVAFIDSPMFELQGGVKEQGTLEMTVDPNIGIAANQYEHKVDFVQIVKLKERMQTSIKGTIKFQVCTEHECLPPSDTHFDIPLKG